MLIPLTIKKTYRPSWGAKEGLRELVQNGKDAETEFKAPFSVSRYKTTLRLENEGVSLAHEALLLGHTTKAERKDLIGQWGEGLKIGVLALVRAGKKVKIRCGDEVWIPSIRKAKGFDAEVLVFDIQKRVKQDRVRVEVNPISKEEWEELIENTLFLQELGEDEVVKGGYHGELLLGERFKGRTFVKGLYVGTDPELNYGYNYYEAGTDPERQIVDAFDLRWANTRIWKEAVSKRPDLFDKFFVLVDEGEKDVEGIESLAISPSDEIVTEIAARFAERHGEDAIPVGHIGDSKELEHLGKKGIVASKQVQAIVSKKTGSVETVKQALRKEVLKKYSWHELSKEEQSNLETAIELVSRIEEASLDDFDVVDFRSDDLQGQFKDDRLFIAKRLLEDRDETLAVVVHEVAHRGGVGDGEFSHVRAIENIWGGIVASLRGESK